MARRKKLQEAIQTDDKQPLKTVLVQSEPVGASGTELFAGYFSEEYLNSLRGNESAKVYDKMRRGDAQVAMLMAAIKNPIRSANWDMECADDSEMAHTHAEFIERVLFEDLEQGWGNFLFEGLSFVDFGHAVFEEVHKVIFSDPEFGTYNSLARLGFRSQKTIERWNVEKKTGKLLSVYQQAWGDVGDNATIPGEFLLVLTNQKEGDNYEGISALRPLYGPYFRKNVYLKIVAIGLEKYAIGTPIGTIPKGKENSVAERERFEDMLAAYTSHQKAYFMLTDGWKIELLRGDFDASKVKEIIQFENTEMVKALVANFLDLGIGGTGGAFALSNDLSDFFLGGIQCYANVICDALNRKTIPNLIKLNYGPQRKYPKLKCTGISDKAGKELADILGIFVDKKIVQADAPLEDFLRKLYSLPKKAVLSPELPEIEEDTQPPAMPVQLVEKLHSMLLDESYRKKFKSNQADLKILMQEHLTRIYGNLKFDILKNFNAATDANKISATNGVVARGVPEYKKALKEFLGDVGTQAMADARKEVPKSKNVKLSFDDMPTVVQKALAARANIVADTQTADLEKITFFQFNTTVSSGTTNPDTVAFDMDEATTKVIAGSTGTGMSVDAAAGDAIGMAVNVARNAFFFDSDVLDEIAAFEFVNEDPVSEICQDLNGTIFAPDDPGVERYAPPLHHNCKSRIVPILKGKDKVDTELLRPSKASLEKFITLTEKAAKK